MPRAGEPAPTTEEVNKRRLEAMRLRRAGLSYHSIAEKLGVSPSQAYDDVMHHIRKLNRELKEETPELRAIEAARLDRCLEILEPKIETSVDAMETYLKVIAQRRRLFGLDAPTVKQIEIDDKRTEAKRLSAVEAWKRLKGLAERLERSGIPLNPALRATLTERNPYEPLPDIEAQPVLALPDTIDKD